MAESNFEDFLTQNNTFASLVAYDYGVASVSGGSEPARVNVAAVSSGFFPTLGIQPLRGRLFAADEQRPHGASAVIVSYSYSQRKLGSAADLSKFHLDLDGGVYAVVPRADYLSNSSVAWCFASEGRGRRLNARAQAIGSAKAGEFNPEKGFIFS